MMKIRRLLGVILVTLWVSAMIVLAYGYGDVFIPLPVAVPTIFINASIPLYAISLIVTDSFTALPKAIVDLFRK